jgi:hypothetical protein
MVAFAARDYAAAGPLWEESLRRYQELGTITAASERGVANRDAVERARSNGILRSCISGSGHVGATVT